MLVLDYRLLSLARRMSGPASALYQWARAIGSVGSRPDVLAAAEYRTPAQVDAIDGRFVLTPLVGKATEVRLVRRAQRICTKSSSKHQEKGLTVHREMTKERRVDAQNPTYIFSAEIRRY